MSHLTKAQRYTIEVLLSHGGSQKSIAAYLEKSPSVISREIHRNCDFRSGLYSSDLAQRKYDTRISTKPKRVVFNLNMKQYVDEKLAQKLSPEQIKGEAQKDGVACISHESIYQYIWQNKKEGGQLHKHLRTEGKRYRHRGASKDRRGIILGRIDITQRPAVVDQRERFGDLEIDTIIGKDHKGAIVTINDRATGILRMRKLKSKDADELADKVCETLQPWKDTLKTITSDNGKEFASHQKIADTLGINFYFAKPYHSWERGSNENLNGLIRQFIPKKTNFEFITDQDIQSIEDQLNNRPRKRFNFNSPNEFYNQKIAFVA